jgi:hypothetical protein
MQLERELRHPLRQQIVQAVEADEARTAPELAELLEQPLARIRYHLRVLRVAGESRDRQPT